MSELPPPDPARRPVWQRKWFQAFLATLVVFLVLSYVLPMALGLLYALRSVLVPVLIGLGLAYIVSPALRFAERRLRIGRLAGTISVMLLAGVLLAVILVTAVPLTIKQGNALFNTVKDAYPRYVERLLAQLDVPEPPAETVPPGMAATAAVDDEDAPPEVAPDATPQAVPDVTPDATVAPGVAPDVDVDVVAVEAEPVGFVDQFYDPEANRRLLRLSVERLQALDWQTIAGWAMSSLDVGVGLVGSAVSFTSYLLLAGVVIGFCFFFFSWKLPAIGQWFVPFIPISHRRQVLGLAVEMDRAVSSFVRGRVVQSGVMMLVMVVGWFFAGVPYWFLLGVLMGFLNLVPFLPAAGWLLAVGLTVMSTLAAGGDFTLGLLLWPTAVYFAAQCLDGWVVEPLVQGQATNLDPLTVMLVVLMGGALAGLLGMLLAIPLAACIKIVAREVVLPRLRELAARGSELLAVGGWRLAVGGWLLAAGCWLHGACGELASRRCVRNASENEANFRS